MHTGDYGGVSLAIGRQRQPSATSVNKLHAAFIFEMSDAARDSGMFDAQGAGGGRQTAQTSKRLEVPKVFPVRH